MTITLIKPRKNRKPTSKWLVTKIEKIIITWNDTMVDMPEIENFQYFTKCEITTRKDYIPKAHTNVKG